MELRALQAHATAQVATFTRDARLFPSVITGSDEQLEVESEDETIIEWHYTPNKNSN